MSDDGFHLPSGKKTKTAPTANDVSFLRGGDQANGEGPTNRRPTPLRRLHIGERVVAYLADREQAEALRVRCVRERRSVSDAVTQAVAEWLART